MASHDPEQYIGQWAREGVPLGMDVEVPHSRIYPRDPQEPLIGDKDEHGGVERLTQLRVGGSPEGRFIHRDQQVHAEGILQNPAMGGTAQKIPRRHSKPPGANSETEARWKHQASDSDRHEEEQRQRPVQHQREDSVAKSSGHFQQLESNARSRKRTTRTRGRKSELS